MMLRSLEFWLGGLAVAFASCSVSGQVVLTNMGSAPGGAGTFGSAISSSGSAAAGSTTGFRAFAWTSGIGNELLALLPTGVQSSASDISDDGAVVVGSCSAGGTVYPVRWVSGTIENLGILSGVPNGSCNATNHDGSVIVGSSSFNTVARGWKWTAFTGLQALEALSAGYNTAASGLTPDATVIVGYAESSTGRYAVRWTQDGIQNLGRLPGAIESIARAVSDDGLVVVGSSGPSFSIAYAFRWTSNVGMQALPVPPAATSSSAAAISQDGSIIVGSCRFATGNRAAVWRHGSEVWLLQDLLVAAGLNMAGWDLTVTSDVSPDGRILSGSGTFNGEQRGWIVSGLRLTACDSIDFNNDGSRFDPEDVDAFLRVFSEGPC